MTDDTTSKANTGTDLAAEIADWTPPWQRQDRADTPPDEPVEPDTPRQLSPEAAPEPPPTPPTRTPARSVDPLPLAEDLPGTLEAILMVCEEPVGEAALAEALGRPETEITDALRQLAAEYTGDGRGFDLRRQAGGWRYYTRDDFAPYVERFVLDGQQVRLTKAALETLAVVAYQQPVTRGRISAIRGVNCDGVIRTLTTRGLIEECGAEPDSGAHLYRTTSMFLEKLGLNSVSELPPLAPFLPTDLTEIGESSET
ncbi:segregation and condensation protein B [Stackebrandtia endophytica]|uniref:Segregation and condensation protein B n=1 Tax=Stackebrandtia endophytica TaxID=1496996 RepID=A0A543AQZ2_9ACTN|nr:SMC-Scp complex subunit ScpB [Stackebrandtia endophytica]TQL74989.1 segregation and condensation protein B [Stackebrandtia endophytica]